MQFPPGKDSSNKDFCFLCLSLSLSPLLDEQM